MAKERRTTGKAAKTATTEKKMISAPETYGKLQAHELIGRKLREYYDEVAKQPVPDRFSALLDQLEGKSAGKKPR
jgi:Anti-sigma factor NepR